MHLSCLSLAFLSRLPLRWRAVALACVLGGGAGGALAQDGPSQSAKGIYSCVDAAGKRHTADRPIPECLDREQRVLNRDGSQRRVLPPRMTAEQRVAEDERLRQQQLAEVAHKDAVRRDRNLMMRFPNESAHNKAREAALDDLRKAIGTSEANLKQLRAERQPLDAEAEFYKGKRVPQKLRLAVESNQAQQQAQLDIIQQQRAEMVRISALYDAELARLKKLWAGAAPGSVPVVEPPPSGPVR